MPFYKQHFIKCGNDFNSLNGALRRAIETKAYITVEAYKISQRYKNTIKGKENYIYAKYCDFHTKKALQNPQKYYEFDSSANYQINTNDYKNFIQNEISEKVSHIDKGYTSAFDILDKTHKI